MNLVILEPSEPDASGEVTLTGTRGAHLARVLKARPDQQIRIGLVDGPFGTGTVTRMDGDAVTLRCAFERAVPPRPRIDLLLALPRPKVMRRLWAQLAAMGVGQIILTNAGRVERDYFDTHILNEDTYRPLLIEGLQQARDTRLPRVSIHTRFKVLVEDQLDALFAGGVRVVAHPGASGRLEAVARGKDERVLLAVGPDGGWNGFELRLLESHGFQAVGMGARTLRVDTACIALLAILDNDLTR